jgi:hypothetical protein
MFIVTGVASESHRTPFSIADNELTLTDTGPSPFNVYDSDVGTAFGELPLVVTKPMLLRIIDWVNRNVEVMVLPRELSLRVPKVNTSVVCAYTLGAVPTRKRTPAAAPASFRERTFIYHFDLNARIVSLREHFALFGSHR